MLAYCRSRHADVQYAMNPPNVTAPVKVARPTTPSTNATAPKVNPVEMNFMTVCVR